MELTLALGVAVVLSAALGWALHALWARLPRRPGAEDPALQALSLRLAEAEAARDALPAEAAARRAALAERLARVETALTHALPGGGADRTAAMKALGRLRREIEALKREG